RHTRFSRDWSSDVCSSDLYRLSLSLPRILFRSHPHSAACDHVRGLGPDAPFIHRGPPAWPPEEIPRQYRPPAGHSLRGADLRLDSPPQIPHPLRHSPWWDGLSEGADALDRTAP